jgi:clan AA aspartic protease (TIGR02281 family)
MVRVAVFIISVFLSAACFPPQSSAWLYRWTDAGGATHVSDNPADVPPAHRSDHAVMREEQDADSGFIIPFERTASGLILVDALLNGVKAKMVFDTGADIVVITRELAERLRQDLSQGSEVITLNTSCGQVEGRSFIMNEIELGGMRKEHVRSIITPDESVFKGFDGLLGLSFLGDFTVTIDYKNARLVVGKEHR